MTDDMVGPVARAMKQFAAQPLGNLESLEPVMVGSLGDAWKYLARAAIAAHEAALAAAGMVIVPRGAVPPTVK